MQYITKEKPNYNPETQNCFPQYSIVDGKFITNWLVADKESSETENNAMDEMTYSENVVMLIRQRYSLSDEIAILRQRNTKPEEFKEYFEFAEECKLKAKGSNINEQSI